MMKYLEKYIVIYAMPLKFHYLMILNIILYISTNALSAYGPFLDHSSWVSSSVLVDDIYFTSYLMNSFSDHL